MLGSLVTLVYAFRVFSGLQQNTVGLNMERLNRRFFVQSKGRCCGWARRGPLSSHHESIYSADS